MGEKPRENRSLPSKLSPVFSGQTSLNPLLFSSWFTAVAGRPGPIQLQRYRPTSHLQTARKSAHRGAFLMIKRVCSIGFSLIAAGLVGTVQAQENLSAKANSFQPQPASVSASVADNDRLRDGLLGPVRRIKTEIAKLTNSGGKLVEDKRVVLESSAYDLKGHKTENTYSPIAGATLTGREIYKYDDKGNISEMTLHSTDGSLVSKEVYNYEFDFAGNWTKMTTSVAVVDGGKVSFEPTEVTY